MRDPQRWANALFSSVLHQIQTTGKGIMAERGAFENDQDAEKAWANGSKIAWLNAGSIAGQKIQQVAGDTRNPTRQDQLQQCTARNTESGSHVRNRCGGNEW